LNRNASNVICARVEDAAHNVSDCSQSCLTFVEDNLAPTTGTVLDGLTVDRGFQTSTNTMEVSWSGFADSGSGIVRYEHKIAQGSCGRMQNSPTSPAPTSWSRSSSSLTSIPFAGVPSEFGL